MQKPPIRRIRARTTTIAVLAATMLLIASMASAVTIDPSVNDFVLEEGETWTETITVDIPADTAASKVDVYFLADTTGSMGGPISAVRTGANAILTGLAEELSETDLRFGVGDFKDFQSSQSDPYAFRNAQSLTDDAAAVTTAINGWSASGGVDGPEGQFYAYDQLASNRAPSNDGSPAGSIGWRADAAKILVVFADIAAHDPVCSAITARVPGHEVGYDITEESATAKLVAAGITFIGISTGTGPGMDGNPTTGSDYVADCGAPEGTAGQATRIAEATGGVHQIGINNASIVNVITESVVTAARSILSLTLEADGEIVPFVTGIDPAAGYGPIDTSDASTSTFEVDWEGVVAATAEDQVFTGALNVVADGRVIASKPVRITVPGTGGLYPPEPEVLGEVLYPPAPEVLEEATPATPVAAQPDYTG